MVIAASAFALLSPPNSYSQDVDRTLYGHQVVIDKDAEGQQALKIDDKTLVTDAIVALDEVHEIDGFGVVVGSASNGGNACDSKPFVILLPKTGMPRLDGPLDSCSTVTVKLLEGKLFFSTEATPRWPADRWEWTTTAGFKKLQDKPFVAETSKGWAQLEAHARLSQDGLLGYADVASQIDRLAGSDKELVRSILSGTSGEGGHDGDIFVETACSPHNCGSEEGIVVADLTSKKIFLAWKPLNQKIKVNPPVNTWPSNAKMKLRDWAQTFK